VHAESSCKLEMLLANCQSNQVPGFINTLEYIPVKGEGIYRLGNNGNDSQSGNNGNDSQS